MKRTLQIAGLFLAVMALAACGPRGGTPEPETPTGPLFPTAPLPTASPQIAAQRAGEANGAQPVEESMEEPVMGEETADVGAVEAPAVMVEAEAGGLVAEDFAPPPGQDGDQGQGDEGGQPDTMIFQDYGTNPFVETAQDALSTFATDVDTGSYTLTRSYLREGILPPPEAVRLEEFVNYFAQDYPLPTRDEGFEVRMEAAPAPWSAEDSYVMRVGVQGYDIRPEDRPDAVLIFVVDVSGSMDRGDRLGAVKESLAALLDNLRPSDAVGIVVYGSQGRVLLPPTPVSQRQLIESTINQLQPDGSTNAEEGLRLAYALASESYDAAKINRLILCSDGVANVGQTGPDAILETVRQQARDGITLSTVGFGMGNYNDVLMEQLADDGDGQYFYVDTPSEAQRIFVDRLAGTLQTIARDAKIQVEFNPDTVSYYRLMGYENRDVADEDFRNDAVDAGEIGAGHSVTALYEIIPAGNPSQGVVATARLRWADPASGEVTEIERTLTADEVRADFDAASPRFRQDVVAAAFADVLGNGGWMQTVSPDDLMSHAAQVAEELGNDGDVAELHRLIQLAYEMGG
jgi:Ca-activated chloride channel family protein